PTLLPPFPTRRSSDLLRLLKAEGLETRITRTSRLAEAARAAIDALGLELYPDRRYASNTVTAIRYPPGIDDAKFRKELRERHRTDRKSTRLNSSHVSI